jgi:hypothetical protein
VEPARLIDGLLQRGIVLSKEGEGAVIPLTVNTTILRRTTGELQDVFAAALQESLPALAR